MRRVEKPWGHEIIFAETDHYVGKILHIKKGHRLSRQYHREKEETLFVFSGKIELVIGPQGEETVKVVEVGESFHIRPGTVHRFAALEDTELVEVSTPQLMDVVRLEDDYGRDGTNSP